MSGVRPGAGFLFGGLLRGVSAGAFTGLLDAGRALGSPGDLVQPADALDVVLFYAVAFAPLGLLAAAVARYFSWPHRMRSLLLVTGSLVFFAGAWLNVSALPGFTEPLSLFVDGLLLAAAVAVVVVRYRAPGEDLPHGARWFLLGAGSALIAFLLGVTVPSRGEGPRPAARGPDGDPAARPNVLLVLVDTLRADRLSCYGYARPTSPEFDRFAADATRFADCRAVTSWTKPSVASLFTAMYPSVHACKEQREVLVPEAETMAEVFRAAGWRTAAFTDNPFVTPEFGFGQGFDRYDAVRPSVVVNGTLLGKALFMTRLVSLVGRPLGVGEAVERGAPVLHANLLRFLGEPSGGGDAPWFAYVHAMEPHLPYTPARTDAEAMGFPAGETYAEPPRYNGILPFQQTDRPDALLLRKLIAQYDGEIRGWSRSFGDLLAQLAERGLMERTIVIVCADHGEEFCEHGGWTHGHSLHREVTQVPLVIRVPDAVSPEAARGRGRVVLGVATLLDVAPTLYDLCGIRYPGIAEPNRSGRSLLPQLLPGADGRDPSPAVAAREILGEVTMSPVGLRSIREGRHQLIRAEAPLRTAKQLYDDVSDPGHRKDRAADDPATLKDLEARMDDLFRRLGEVALRGGAREIDPETAEQLRKLGYLGK